MTNKSERQKNKALCMKLYLVLRMINEEIEITENQHQIIMIDC